MQLQSSRREPAHATLPAARMSVYVHPGDLHVSPVPCSISTILGSCVAVCLHDRTTQIGGLNHFVMPQASRAEQTNRFGDVAIDALVDLLIERGASAARLTAKVFGGAWSIEATRNSANDLGSRNVDVARLVLSRLRIPIVAEDVGGSQGRKVVYRTDDGVAFVKKLGGAR